MRVLRIFFTAVLILVVVSVFVGLITREVLLSMGVSRVRTAARELRSTQVQPDFIQNCLEYGGLPFDEQSLTRNQLRFISNREFILEVVCQTSESLRYTLRSAQLPPLVKKGFNQSGLIQGNNFHGITLSVLGRTGVVYEDESFVRSSLSYSDTTGLTLDDGPATVCEGYGFSCCNDISQLGQDPLQTAALDCPRSCYSGCTDKPVVLTFNSDPSPITNTRLVQVQTGSPVEFFYVINDIGGENLNPALFVQDAQTLSLQERLVQVLENLALKKPAADIIEKVVITFGDGEFSELSDLQGTVNHTYTCTRSLCVYNATIQAVTRAGVTSTLTDLSKMQVQVQPQ